MAVKELQAQILTGSIPLMGADAVELV